MKAGSGVDELLAAVQRAAGSGYQVYGELGRENQDDIWYLARDRETNRLVAMRLYVEATATEGNRDYALEVARELNASVSVGMGECQKCAMPVRRWGRFCTRCGANLADSGVDGAIADREAVLALVRREAGEVYEVLGEMPWSGGGEVFFALEKASGRLVRLRLRKEEGQSVVRETQALMQLGDRLQAGYLTEPPKPPPPTAPAPKPTESVPAYHPGFRSSSVVPPAHSDILPPRQRVEAEPAPRVIRETSPSHRRPIRRDSADWGAPLSGREWLFVAVIIGLLMTLLLT